MAKQVKKQKKELLDWLVPLICIVIAAGVLVGLLFNPIKNGIDYTRSRNITLIESEDGNASVKRPVAQAITWLKYYDVFSKTYSNYSWYSYYTNLYGDNLNFSSLISDEDVAWVESNLYTIMSQTGMTFYTYSDVDGKTITEEDVSTSASLFALYIASNLESNFGSYFGNYLDAIKSYVAIAAAANAAGVTLDEEDLASVDESMDGFKALPESLSYTKSFANFLKTFVGKSIKESDVREAYELMTLVSKYSTMVSDQYYDGITDAERVAYRDENKGDFYTAEYIKYSTEDQEIVERLKAAATKDAFRKIAAEAILDTRYAVEVANLEKEVLTQSIDTPDDLEISLDGAGFDALATYETGDEAIDAALSEAFFNGEEKSAASLYVVEAEEGAYLVWFKEITDTSVTVRTKFFAYDGMTSYDGISTFRADVYKTVIDSIDSDATVYALDTESSAFHSIADKCLSAVKDTLPGSSTASYKDDAEAGSFEAWISDLTLVSGATASFEKVEDGKTSYSVYLLLSPMELDDTASVNGAYLKYEAEDKANEGKAKIEGKTGTALVNALQELDSNAAVASSAFLASSFDGLEDLKGWFFSSDRKNGDVAIIATTKETVVEATEDTEETVETTTEYYLVAFHSAMSIWESKATESAADEKTNDWVKALNEALKVNEKELTRLGVDLTHDHDDEE